MRLVVIITLGLGICGPMLIDAEKVVFVVPRYIRRSFTGNSSPFHNHDQSGYKIRPLKRPYFSGHYGPSPVKSSSFFHGENHRVPQGGDDFDQKFFTPQREVNHVIIPHGKGISHGISFGKGYIPHDEFKSGGNEDFEYPVGNGNNVDYAVQNHQGDVKFEDEGYARFQNEDQASGGPQNTADWTYNPSHESGYVPENQETDQEESRLELQDKYNRQGRSSAEKEEFYFPQGTLTGSEKPRAILVENLSQGSSSGNAVPHEPPVVMIERKPTPIILQDTIDMREYVQKVEDFAKSWPPAAALQGFGWKNQILNPPSLTIPNYQGLNSWSNSLLRPPSTGGYQVQEDSVEEPSETNFRTVTM